MKQDKPLLNRVNRLFAHLLITPFAILIYTPINKNLILPVFGSGAPYTDIDGNVVESYFSANHFSLLLALCLFALSLILTVRLSRSIHRLAVRILYIAGCSIMCLLTFVCFLEFSFWSA